LEILTWSTVSKKNNSKMREDPTSGFFRRKKETQEGNPEMARGNGNKAPD